MIRKAPCFALFLTAAVVAAEPFDWKFDASESWKAEPSLPLCIGFDGLELLPPKMPEWGKPPVVYSLREAGSQKTPGNPEQIEFEAELLSGGGATLGLCLQDADGEFFAYPQRPLKPGLNRVGWKTASEAIGSWGEKKNGKVDFPVRLEALQLHQYPAKEAARVLLRTPEPETAEGSRRVVRSFVKFDDTARWKPSGELECGPEPDGLRVRSRQVPEPGKPAVIGRLKEVMFDLKEIGSPDAVGFDVELLDGSGVNLALELVDAAGENFSMKQKPLRKGANRVVWDLRHDIAGSWGKNKDGRLDLPVRIANLVVLQFPARKPAELLFRDGLKRETLRDIDAVEARLDTGNPLNILKPGAEKPLKFRFRNRYPEKNVFTARLRLYTLTGAERCFERSFELAPGEEAAWPLDWPAASPRGIWRCDLVLRNASGREQRLNRPAFACLTPAGPTEGRNPEFEIGMNMRQQGWSRVECERESQAAAAIGAKLLRTGFTWESLEPAPGEFRFELLDELLAMNAKYGMRQIFMVAYTPAWAAKPGLVANAKDWNEWNKSAPDPDALEAFVEKFAEHYRGKIEFYEFWNEPDLDFWRGTAEEYLECLKRVRRALKKSDPEAKLITGGFAYVGARSKPGFQEQVLAEGQDDFDFHGYHQHGDFSEYERVLEGPLARMRRVLRSPKPIFFTETGFYISNGNYLQQAENVVRKIVHAWATGARGYLWFNMRDDGFLPGYCEHNYGLVTNDWYPKEGFAAFNTLNLLLGQARYGGVLLRNPRTTAHWFRRDDGQAVVFWKSGRGTVEEPLTLLTDAAEAEFVDLFGNATPLKLSAGRLTVPVPEHPGYLLLKGAARAPECGRSVVSFAGTRVTASPGVPSGIRVTLHNPLPAEAVAELRWKLPENIDAPAPGKRRLATGEAVELVLPVTVSEATRGGIVRPELQVRLNGGDWSSISIPVNVATRIADGAYPAEPQFTLDSRANLVSQMEHNPYTAHRVWSGPEDQNVRIFLASDDTELKFRVEVTDDVHVKSPGAASSFMEDGIQLALAVPGQNGHWEFGFAELEDGSPGTHCWIRPDNLAEPRTKLAVSARDRVTIYEIAIPLAGIGAAPEQLKRGIQFNLLVNDNDGEGRDGWMQIAPGIGEAKNPELYPFILK